jgi:hypothetical protein
MSKSKTVATQAIQATIYWANLSIVNSYSGKYQVDLSNLSDAAVDFFKKHGVNVRNKNDERGNFVTSKSGYEIHAYTEDGDKIDSKVGNGSQAKVALNIVEGTSQFGPWVAASIRKLVITDLVEFGGSDGDDDGTPVSFDDAL